MPALDDEIINADSEMTTSEAPVSLDISFEDEAEDNNPQATIKKLRERLKICEKERQEYLEGWQRAKADFINARKDEDRERSLFRKYAKTDILYEILPILDNFERAMLNKKVWERVDQNWRMGVEYIYGQLVKLISEHGLSTFGKVGDKFDPSLHHSVEVIKTEEAEKDGILAQILEQGYRFQDRVVRPAKVNIWQSIV